jgi:Transposase IS4
MTDFFAVLFVMSVQKRKDKPSNWFSDNPLLESKVAKKITTGRQFGKMLRYLHCCDPDEDGKNDDGEYDPSYKINELKNELQKRWSTVFIPGQQLSLDETLLRAFGRMKFKVRIISKAARYGIKLYVITDAVTSFVLGIIVYTGRFTYVEATSESTKKTVQVVQQLCEPFRGTYRTIYIDRFYSSVDLLKQLEAMKLYTTGTVLSNRLPKQLTIAKNSKEFKALNRGDSICHTFIYKTLSGAKKRAGLVAWKDRNMVYCLTNDTSTVESGECKRRSQGGIITLKRPEVISKYNQYMGGVDVADMRRLHCNSTIMGQNRWWLKLFFYLLDAGTSNALVIYNESMKGKQEPFNIADYKIKVVEALVGGKLKDGGDDTACAEHAMVSIASGERQRCSYCAATGLYHRTRYMCEGCGVPYCSIGSGKTGQDCFAIAHDNEEIRLLCVQKYQRQQAHTRKSVSQKR